MNETTSDLKITFPLALSNQGGTSEEDRLLAVAAGEAGSYFLFGRTGGVFKDLSAGAIDLAVIKLDENGTELWRWQVISVN